MAKTLVAMLVDWKAVTRMDTLKSGWTHCIYYTTQEMIRVQVYITFSFPWTLLEPASFDMFCNKHNVSNLIFKVSILVTTF